MTGTITPTAGRSHATWQIDGPFTVAATAQLVAQLEIHVAGAYC